MILRNRRVDAFLVCFVALGVVSDGKGTGRVQCLKGP